MIYDQGKNVKKACEFVAKKSWDYWIKEEEDVVDDITVIVA